MLELGLKTLIAYLLGTLLGSLVLGRLRGVDIRSYGQWQRGRDQCAAHPGQDVRLGGVALDIGKGVLAVLWVPALALPGVASGCGCIASWLALACGLAVIVGHVYPVWFAFRGGKGVATVVGVIGALEPRLLLAAVGCWLLRAAADRICGPRQHARRVSC